MIIGKMDRRVTLQALSVTKDSKGGTVKTWSTLGVVWAGVRYPATMAMNEGEEAGVETSIIPVEFTIRWRQDITINETIRVYYQSKYYDVKRVNEIGRKEMLKLVTEKRV